MKWLKRRIALLLGIKLAWAENVHVYPHGPNNDQQLIEIDIAYLNFALPSDIEAERNRILEEANGGSDYRIVNETRKEQK